MAYIQVTGPQLMSSLRLIWQGWTVTVPGRCSTVYTQLAVLTNPNPEPGDDPASVTLYESDQDGNTYILLQDGVLVQVTVPEGVDVATIGMVDLTVDGVVLFSGGSEPLW